MSFITPRKSTKVGKQTTSLRAGYTKTASDYNTIACRNARIANRYAAAVARWSQDNEG